MSEANAHLLHHLWKLQGLHDRQSLLHLATMPFRILGSTHFTFMETYVALAFWYFFLCALVHYIFPLIFHLQSVQSPKSRKIKVSHDAAVSLVSVAVKTCYWIVGEWIHRSRWGRTFPTWTYDGKPWSLKSAAVVLLTVCLLDLTYDCWFYWIHRALHWSPLYRMIHYQHHRAIAPTAFSTYSFHPMEGALYWIIGSLVQLFMPISAPVHRFYRLYDMAIHIGGHAGFEMAPFIPNIAGIVCLCVNGLKHTPGLTTVQHHDLHHKCPNKNFALLFTHWDRYFGTLHPTYDKELFWYWEDKSSKPKESAAEDKKSS